MPEVIAILAGTVKQARRGLVALGRLPESSPAHALLVDVEDLLKAMLRASEHLVQGESLTTEDMSALASFPARLQGYDEQAITRGPVAVVVHSDPGAHRELVSATGGVEPAYLVMRDTSKDGLLLAVGAHQSHHEVVDDRRTHPTAATDAGWRARLKAKTSGIESGRGSWVSSFRLSSDDAKGARVAPR